MTEARQPAVRFLTNAAGIKRLAEIAESHGWDWYERPIDREQDKIMFCVHAPTVQVFDLARRDKSPPPNQIGPGT